MLVLSRRVGEEVVIDKQIRLIVSAIEGGRVRFAISAPASVHIRRHELQERESSSSSPPAAGVCETPASKDNGAPLKTLKRRTVQ